MFNKDTLKNWLDITKKTTTIPSEVVIELLNQIELRDQKIEKLINSLEFYESRDEAREIRDEYDGG